MKNLFIIKGWTGSTCRVPRIDPVTFTLQTIDYSHHEIHVGDSFSACHYEADFDKADVIGILFTTPNTAKYIHMFPMVYAGAASLFEILRAPTIDAANYPSVFSSPVNRNENSGQSSGILSVRAIPVVNQFAVKRPADSSPVTADGTVVHAEMIGSSKQGGGGGGRDTNERILLRNTTYYYRLSGTAGGADNSVGSIVLSWYEHIDKE